LTVETYLHSRSITILPAAVIGVAQDHAAQVSTAGLGASRAVTDPDDR
jgi:hypothetical protein